MYLNILLGQESYKIYIISRNKLSYYRLDYQIKRRIILDWLFVIFILMQMVIIVGI